MNKISVIFNNKEYNCIQKDKSIFLLFDNLKDYPRGNGWCEIKHESFKHKCFICRSKDNRFMYNHNCVIYDIVFSCHFDTKYDNYFVEFHSDLFDKVFTRFGKKRSFELTISGKAYVVSFDKKCNREFGAMGLMTFNCNKIKESDLIDLYNFVSSFVRFVSLGSCCYPSAFFINTVEGYCNNNKSYDWMKIDFLHINYMSSHELQLLAQYVADNSQFLSNIFFSDDNYISTKDIGSLYSIIDKTLDDYKPRKYVKQIIKKRNIIRHNDILLLIKDFGKKNNLSERDEFAVFYSNSSKFGLSIREKIEFVLDDYLKVFKNDEGVSLSKKEDLMDFAKAIYAIRTFDAHGDNAKKDVVGLGLYYSAFLQELVYYSIFKYALPCASKTIRDVFSNCFSFVSINSSIWIRNKIKQ